MDKKHRMKNTVWLSLLALLLVLLVGCAAGMSIGNDESEDILTANQSEIEDSTDEEVAETETPDVSLEDDEGSDDNKQEPNAEESPDSVDCSSTADESSSGEGADIGGEDCPAENSGTEQPLDTSDDTGTQKLPDDSENTSLEQPSDPSEDDSEGVEPSDESSKTTESSFRILFIDVGQADAALVECDGRYMLIDGGNKADSSLIYSVLQKCSVSVLDIVVGTHAHEDHIGGLPGAFSYTTANLTLCPVDSYDSDAFTDFKRYADRSGGGITIPSVGDTYSLGSAVITILGVNGGQDTNDTSIVLKIQYGETTFLFTGDAEREAEQAIINSGIDLSATVLKVGHHGSDTSTSYLFLRNIAPKYAVISVGEDNSYRHPTEEVLSRLRDADVTVFRTDLQGDIICTSDGTAVTFSVEKNPDADTLVPPNEQTQETTPPQEEGIPSDNGAEIHEYVGNINSKKFHYSWCSSVDRMKESNKYYFTGTREEMLEQGYEPCSNCNP